MSGSADFGLSNSFRLSTSIPFIINRSVNNALDHTVSGFGDLSLSVLTIFNPSLLSKPTNILIGLGATLPVGGGVANVITDERNFASGTVDPIMTFTLVAGISPGWTISSNFYTRQVLASSNGQKTGDLYVYGLKGTFAPVGRSYSISSGLIFINRGTDRINSQLFPNSGGDWIYLSAGGSKELFGSGELPVKAWLEIKLPLYSYVRGAQLTERWELRFGFTAGFSILGHAKEKEQEGHFHLPIKSE